MTEIALPTISWLFTPATCPDRFAKAAGSGVDVIMIDLEDAVAPRRVTTVRCQSLLLYQHRAAKALIQHPSTDEELDGPSPA